MHKYKLILVLAVFCACLGSVTAEETQSRSQKLLELLIDKYGNAESCIDDKGYTIYSLPIEYTRIGDLLTDTFESGGGIRSVTVNGVDEKKSTVNIVVDWNKKRASAKFKNKMAMLAETCSSVHIPWPRSKEALKLESAKKKGFSKKKVRNEITVEYICTDFRDNIKIKGKTYQSKLVFSQLFKSLNSVAGISAPFFERGTYYDVSDGRIMEYTLSCRWGNRLNETFGKENSNSVFRQIRGY